MSAADTRRSRKSGSRPVAEEDELLLRIHRLALTARAVDERLWIMSRQGRANFVLTARGHEIAQIASALAMRPGQDSAWLYYRDMGVGLALGVTPYEIFLGALGRAADPHSGGRQLTIHFSSPRLRIGSVSSVVAGHVPHAVGAAYSARVLGQDSVAVCYLGDGATSEGATHEAMNWAGVHRLPVVFICENNGYAISTPAHLQFATRSIAERAASYGLHGACVDGRDAVAVYRATRQAIARARANDAQPSLLELRIARMTPHSSQDDDLYRSEEQRAAAVRSDPLPALRMDLISRGVLSEEHHANLVREIRAEVAEDEQRAAEQPEPPPRRARRWLYAGDPYLAEDARG